MGILYPNLIEHPTHRATLQRGEPPGAGKPEEDSHMQRTCDPNLEGGQG
jgi:hypothetical protein